MGDSYLLPSIAAVVIGGTNILGGRGRYLGTLVGVVLIVLLNSVLSIMAMPEAGRQVIYGLVIILMLLVQPHMGRPVKYVLLDRPDDANRRRDHDADPPLC